MKFESAPKQPSPEEMAKIEKERALSDAELRKDGAEYKYDKKGNKILEATGEQVEEAKEEMEGKFNEKQEKNRLNLFISQIEYKTGNKLPDDKEELFKNFDQLVPKDIGDITIASSVKSTDKHMSLFRYSRDGIKEMLEKELYGATINEIGDYLSEQIDKASDKFSNGFSNRELEPFLKNGGTRESVTNYLNKSLDRHHAELSNAFNEIHAGGFGIPLRKIESLVNEKNSELNYHLQKGTFEWKNIKQERDNLRNFAERLTLEWYKNNPKENVTQDDVMRQLKDDAKYLSSGSDNETNAENAEMYKRTIENFEKGNTKDALEAIEFSISWAQDRSKELRSRDSIDRELTKEVLNERYGDDSMNGINQELKKLRSYRKLLIDKKLSKEVPKTTEEQAEKQEESTKESRENLEQKELFNQQIENNAYPEAKSLKTDLALFLDDLYRHNGIETVQYYKDELSEILYRNNIEYKKDENIEIPKQQREILEPLLKLRKELDEQETFTESQADSFRRKVLGYLKDIFGIEEIKAKKGEKYEMRGKQVLRAEETGDESMHYVIKESIASGYKINEELWDYYKEKFIEEDRKKQEELKNVKKTVSPDEFDKIYDKYSKWNRSHVFSQEVRPEKVVIYRYKPEQ